MSWHEQKCHTQCNWLLSLFASLCHLQSWQANLKWHGTSTMRLLQRSKAEHQDVIPTESGGQAHSSTQCSTDLIMVQTVCQLIRELISNTRNYAAVHIITAYGEVEAQTRLFLTLALDGDKQLNSLIRRFTCGKRDPSTSWMRAWVSSNTNVDFLGKRKICCPCNKLVCSLFVIIRFDAPNFENI
jgi:hypothetical protein